MPLVEDEVAALDETDASAAFKAVARYRNPRIDHNSAQDTVHSAFQDDRMDKLPATSGHYVTALWDGDLGEAFVRADSSNMRILFSVFDRRFIEEKLVEENIKQRDNVEGFVEQQYQYIR